MVSRGPCLSSVLYRASPGAYTEMRTPRAAVRVLQVMRHEPYDEKCDIYSYSLILWNLFALEVKPLPR